jgi:hypothetical protein
MPNSATPKVKQLTSRLMAYEVAAIKSGGAHKSVAFRVCDKLRQPLSRLTGVAGFRSLLSRALALASGEVRWLKALHVAADGSLEGLDEPQEQLSHDEIAEGEVMLIAQLMGLLVTFIGQALTLRLVQEAWPHAVFDDMQV